MTPEEYNRLRRRDRFVRAIARALEPYTLILSMTVSAAISITIIVKVGAAFCRYMGWSA